MELAQPYQPQQRVRLLTLSSFLWDQPVYRFPLAEHHVSSLGASDGAQSRKIRSHQHIFSNGISAYWQRLAEAQQWYQQQQGGPHDGRHSTRAEEHQALIEACELLWHPTTLALIPRRRIQGCNSLIRSVQQLRAHPHSPRLTSISPAESCGIHSLTVTEKQA